MASELPKGLPEFFVLSRQALWAGDRVRARGYLTRAEELVSPRASRRVNQYASLEDIVAADIEKIRRELDRLEARSENGDLAAGADENPYVSSTALSGVVYGDGFGQFYMRAYLAKLDIEDKFREAVDLAAATGSKVAIREDVEGPEEPEDQKDDSPELGDASREWIDASEFPKVQVHVGEFTLVEARCGWCPLPESGEKVRDRFAAVLRSIDPLE
jgi:hypothetical protein